MSDTNEVLMRAPGQGSYQLQDEQRAYLILEDGKEEDIRDSRGSGWVG